MKFITYNVNGIRSVIKKGILDWLKATDADYICLQEIKANADQLDFSLFEALGYQVFWYPAEKKGYSGVAILSKHPVKRVQYGFGIHKYDSEGRLIQIETDDFTLLSVYMPSGTRGGERQNFKEDWLSDFYDYISALKKISPRLIISGDYNICHKAIDIHNPTKNLNSSGFLPQEREWMDKFEGSGFIDAFRFFNKEPHHYTWWSTRSGAREKNLGWRIDYHFISNELQDRLQRCLILNKVPFSDHCPLLLELN
ncbi:MAG: exodeoxyribonuclease III [Cytophagales bacterium]|nr:MAG: exodeoxyribonuclease III [Cytophagales bacterium]